MTDSERRRWQAYFRAIGDLFGLKDWELKVLDEPCGDDADATTRCIGDYQQAEVRLHAGFSERPPARQRHVILHELLHVHLWRLAQELDGPKEELGAAAWNIFWNSFQRREEAAVDAIATAIAPFFPLPKAYARR